MDVVRRTARLTWHLLVLEVTMYRNLLRWIARRPAIGPHDEPVGYVEQATPVIWLWIFASAAELPLVHVLVPWHGVRIALLVVGVWGLVWMLGMLAGLHMYPHLMTPTSLRVRSGALVEVPVPWSQIATVVRREQDLASTVRSVQVTEDAHGVDLRVGVSGRTNLTVELRGPLPVETRQGTVEADRISFWVDDPRRTGADLRARVKQHAEA